MTKQSNQSVQAWLNDLTIDHSSETRLFRAGRDYRPKAISRCNRKLSKLR